MQDLLSKANSIELKIKQLKAKYELLLKENAYLKEENKNLSEKLKQQKGLIKELEIKSSNKESKAPSGLTSEERTKINAKIDKQIDQIDKTIDLLRS